MMSFLTFPLHHPYIFVFGLLLLGLMVLYLFFGDLFSKLLDMFRNLSAALRSLIDWFRTPTGQMFGIVLVLAAVFMAGWNLREDYDQNVIRIADLNRQLDKAQQDLKTEKAASTTQAQKTQELDDLNKEIEEQNSAFREQLKKSPACIWTPDDINGMQQPSRRPPR